MQSRFPLIDALKALACLAIVLHHLAVYGPMSDAAYTLVPGIISGLYDYGRIAVQVFLVIGGFLAARSLAPQGEPLPIAPLWAIGRRYCRLALPYLAALALAILCAAFAREWMESDAIPDVPNLPQLFAHALLLQNLLGQESLSAGVWYIAIDFQLFALISVLFWLAEKTTFRTFNAIALIALMTIVSMFGFNRYPWWDNTAFYFFGAYGLGVLSYWAGERRLSVDWLILIGGLAAAALLLDFRLRLLVAAITALGLGYARRTGALEQWAVPTPLLRLGRISYSVFLVHFPLSLVVNAVFSRWFPQQPVINSLGLVLALAISVYGGALFHRWVESRAFSYRERLLIPAGLIASSLFAVLSDAL